ncbi:MAG: GDSL-type esterase/lipase family protein [Agathobacter sp.]|jgi:hypothetical protein|nr:GDSL-type esterase/lipase family protein [Agathobacter sp.]
MNGPAAPKDPEKKRPYFYILKDKEIFGAKQPDGSAIHFIYESDGRLINSAQIVGNITDEEELRLLESVEGFGRLVHSIGVSVETDNPKEEIEFVFQMYGRKNLYGGGTNLRCKLTGDGMEHRIYLSDYTWTEDDYIPGQIKFIMSTPEKLGKASVRLYLNDGYMAPEEVEEAEVDTKSENYCAMIAKSLMNLGNTYRIRKAIEKAKAGKSVTVAYIGGSITQGAGATPINTECYAYKSYQLFQNRFASGNNVKFIKAGVGGTPSELGMLRFDRDVLRDGEKPDIVIVEFAVNDEGDETKGDCYESLVRKILKLDWNPEVVLLFSVFANDWNLQERLRPVGDLYDLPMVSIRDAVVEQFTRKEGRVLTKNQFFYDMFHPSNIGHTIMADCLQYLFERCELREHARLDAFENGLTEEGMLLQRLKLEPVIGGSFENVRLMDKKDVYEGAVIETGDFTATDQELQSVEMDDALNLTPEFPYNWMYDGTKTDAEAFTLRMNCKALVLIFKDSGEVDVGKAEVFVDGAHVLTADPHINNWQHCNAAILFNNENSEEHTVKIEIAKEDIDKKFTILGFGYVL